MTEAELREQLEEFALHMKPGTTKGKHRTAIFDTLELTKLVQALLHKTAIEARIDEAQKIYTNYIPVGTLVAKAVRNRIRRYKATLKGIEEA